jgi:hypothetical protein
MKKSPAVAGYVYAIHSPAAPHHVKLGLSSNPQARLRQLQTGNPHKLRIIWTHPSDNMANTESAFHQAFDRYRIPGGEWFDFRPISDPEHLAMFLELLAVKHFTTRLPAKLQQRLAGLESFINSPERFLASQASVDSIMANQFSRTLTGTPMTRRGCRLTSSATCNMIDAVPSPVTRTEYLTCGCPAAGCYGRSAPPGAQAWVTSLA